MKLKHYFSIYFIAILLIIPLVGCWGHGESSYMAAFSDIVITIKWMSDSIYRVYVNNIDNPTNEDYIECYSNSWDMDGFEIYFNELSKDSVVYIVDCNKYVSKSHINNYKVVYICSSPDLIKSSKGRISKYIKYTRELDDSIRNNTNYIWSLNNGDWDINVKSYKKKNVNKIRLYLYDRHDKTSE